MDKTKLVMLDKARELYHSGDYDKALPLLLEVKDDFSEYADVMNMLGVIYHDKAEIGVAVDYFECALGINANYTEAALNLVVTYNEQGKYDKARKLHKHAISLKDKNEQEIEPYALGKITNMHAELGHAYAELKMVDLATSQYRAALSLNPNYVDIRLRFGQLLRDEGKHDAAIEQFELALKSKPGFVPAMISLGATHYAKGEKDTARRYWKKASELQPENRTAGMYMRMVDQMLAMEEAEASGVHLEVGDDIAQKEQKSEDDDIEFTFDKPTK